MRARCPAQCLRLPVGSSLANRCTNVGGPGWQPAAFGSGAAWAQGPSRPGAGGPLWQAGGAGAQLKAAPASRASPGSGQVYHLAEVQDHASHTSKAAYATSEVTSLESSYARIIRDDAASCQIYAPGPGPPGNRRVAPQWGIQFRVKLAAADSVSCRGAIMMLARPDSHSESLSRPGPRRQLSRPPGAGGPGRPEPAGGPGIKGPCDSAGVQVR